MPELVYNQAWDFSTELLDYNDPREFVISPTFEVGDVQVSLKTAGGSYSAYTNIATLPVVEPAGTESVSFALIAAELAGTKARIRFKDQTDPAAWRTQVVKIDIPTATPESLASGVIMKGIAKDVPIQILDNKGQPVASMPVFVEVNNDNGGYAPINGSATDTDAHGYTSVSLDVSDITGDEWIIVKVFASSYTAYQPFLISST